MEDFAVGKPNQEVGADACSHALKRVPRSVRAEPCALKLPVLTILTEIRELC